MPPGNPILVSGTHRSGTTWFAKMLSVPGLWYVHEPFNPNKGIWKKSFQYAPPEIDCPRINRFVDALLAGRYRRLANTPSVEHRFMPWRLVRPPIKRVMIKDPIACLLTGYLTQKYELTPLVLIRHPAGFVSSIVRLGWPCGKFLEEFLANQDLMDDHLSQRQSTLERYVERDDLEAAAALHGALNFVICRQARNFDKIRLLQFEQLCESPIESFKKLFLDLNLPYDDSTRQMHEMLCLSGSNDPAEYRTHEVSRRSRAMASSWQRQLTHPEIERVRRVWDEFEIPYYSSDDDWKIPSHENCKV